MKQLTFHLIGNAHLDPVWIWDWREGLNEGITTTRTILDMMDENHDLTFIRGEAAQYEHMEKHAPDVFERVRAYVKAGRWDVVGGTYVQPDTNLTSTETFLRHFTQSQDYFDSRFGLRARVAWAADSFGHSAGLPEILAASGMQGFAFTRPGPEIIAIAKPAFWWEGSAGSRVMAYRPPVGWYGNERDEMPRRLDGLLTSALQGDLTNVGVFFGLGNHGGGPSRRSIADIKAWAEKHPEVKVIYSGLHRFFDALALEVAAQSHDFLPVVQGELNYCLRGCYSSVARLKFFYRRTEASVFRAERTDSVIRASLRQEATRPLDDAWRSLEFNSFHDILPGTLIERATEDQMAWLGGAFHQAQRAENAAILSLADQVDTSVKVPKGDHPSPVALMVWNPHPFAYEGPIEVEANMDYRPIWEYRDRADQLPVEVRDHAGRKLPMQIVPGDHTAMMDFPWRKRAVVRLKVPALGWKIVTMGWVESAQCPETPDAVTSSSNSTIDNGIFRVVAKTNKGGIQVFHQGKSLFGAVGMHVITVKDPYGAWGSMNEQPESLDLSSVIASWQVTDVKVLESGPERASMWVRLAGGKSHLDLRFSVARQNEQIDVEARLFIEERSARIKLVMPCGINQAEFEVPGGIVTRGEVGEVPGGRWVRTTKMGFASNGLYNFDIKNGAFRATLARATRYTDDLTLEADAMPWVPAVDSGELRFKFIIAPGDDNLPNRARLLEEPLISLAVPPSAGQLPRSGSLAEMHPDSMRILSLQSLGEGAVLLIAQEANGQAANARITWLGQSIKLGKVEAGRIAKWRLEKSGSESAYATRV